MLCFNYFFGAQKANTFLKPCYYNSFDSGLTKKNLISEKNLLCDRFWWFWIHSTCLFQYINFLVTENLAQRCLCQFLFPSNKNSLLFFFLSFFLSFFGDFYMNVVMNLFYDNLSIEQFGWVMFLCFAEGKSTIGEILQENTSIDGYIKTGKKGRVPKQGNKNQV